MSFMGFFYRQRFYFPHSVRNKNEAQQIVEQTTRKGELNQFYDGTTIELDDKNTKTGWKAGLKAQLFGK